MNQPDQTNLQSPMDSTKGCTFPEQGQDVALEKRGLNNAEWYPEDDDEWYEPDYRRPERSA